MKTSQLAIPLLLPLMTLLSFGLAYTQIELRRFLAEFSATGGGFVQRIAAALGMRSLWIALGCFLVCGLAWLWILPRVRLSHAYPMISLSYVAMVILSKYMLHETVGGRSVVGIILIIAGVVMVTLGYA
jgi:uncharacterized membrane protein